MSQTTVNIQKNVHIHGGNVQFNDNIPQNPETSLMRDVRKPQTPQIEHKEQENKHLLLPQHKDYELYGIGLDKQLFVFRILNENFTPFIAELNNGTTIHKPLIDLEQLTSINIFIKNDTIFNYVIVYDSMTKDEIKAFIKENMVMERSKEFLKFNISDIILDANKKPAYFFKRKV